MAAKALESRQNPYAALSPFGQFHPVSNLLGEATDIGDIAETERDQFQAMARYCREHLTRPNPNMGRAGPVCPYTPRAIAHDHLLITSARLTNADEEGLVADMRALRGAYLTRDAQLDADDCVFHAIVVIFAGLVTAASAPLIERAHKRLKPEFVAEGLMIGEFYPGCPAPGLYNPNFRPLQTPVSAMVVRHMTLRDAPFLVSEPSFRASYERRFGKEGVCRMRSLLDPAQGTARA